MSFLCSFPLLQGFIIYCYWYDSSYLGIIFDGRIRLRSGFQGFKGFEGSQGKVKELLFLVFVGFVRCYQLLQILFHINYHFFRDHWKDGNGFEASDSWSVIIQSCFHFPLILRRIYYLISLLNDFIIKLQLRLSKYNSIVNYSGANVNEDNFDNE